MNYLLKIRLIKQEALKQKENAKVCAWQSKDLKQQLSEKLTFAKI